jgi:acetylornithine deacetylase/succinyl-diaminopimelate desuccinylase family protein
MSTAPDPGRLAGLLARLVAIDTQNPPGHETAAAELLAAELGACGFATELRTVAPGRANVIARLVNGEGPSFALNSHVDTVPVGAGWSTDPFRLTERHGRLYGRGACDAKGQVSAMAEAGRLLLAERDAWRGTLILAFVMDEEINGTGSKAVAAGGKPFDFVVVGEPTRNAVYAAHKGCLRPLLRVRGKAAHSGRPELGVNAIVAAARLVGLLAGRDAMLRQLQHPLVGHASLTVSRIAGGLADNIVPDACDIVLDERVLPGDRVDGSLEALRELLRRARRDHDVDAEIVEVRAAADPAETPPDSPLLPAALAAAARHGVTLKQPGGLTGGCDLVHFHAAGSVGLVLGPGSLDQAHQPDEFVPKDELAQAALIYRDIARAMLPA